MALTKDEIFEKLDEIFQELFDDDSIHVTPETTADDIDDWDSLSHIDLISAVEDAFDMRFQMKEVSAMKHVGEMVDIIQSRT